MFADPRPVGGLPRAPRSRRPSEAVRVRRRARRVPGGAVPAARAPRLEGPPLPATARSWPRSSSLGGRRDGVFAFGRAPTTCAPAGRRRPCGLTTSPARSRHLGRRPRGSGCADRAGRAPGRRDDRRHRRRGRPGRPRRVTVAVGGRAGPAHRGRGRREVARRAARPDPVLRAAGGLGVSVTSLTDLWLNANADRVIGVTGTKGKSTTSALIHHLLNGTGTSAVAGRQRRHPRQRRRPTGRPSPWPRCRATRRPTSASPPGSRSSPRSSPSTCPGTAATTPTSTTSSTWSPTGPTSWSSPT